MLLEMKEDSERWEDVPFESKEAFSETIDLEEEAKGKKIKLGNRQVERVTLGVGRDEGQSSGLAGVCVTAAPNNPPTPLGSVRNATSLSLSSGWT